MEKKFYRIGEVATLLDVNMSLLRFWEKEFPFLKPIKLKNGERLYTQEHINDLKLVYHLVKEKGYTLAGAREKIKADKSTIETNMHLVGTLKNLKSFLTELKNKIDSID